MDALAREALGGNRRSIGRLISLVEEGRSLRSVMEALLPHTGRAYTVGLTGSPGAGKSTLTERLIGHVRALDKTIGVLAVDPSSPFSGGALLGDRVRMQAHATDPSVFIRSMATRGHLGGISLATPEAVRVLDASGKDVVIVETVGVGQAEVDIADACDTTVVVVNPGWGDAVQTAKAGLMEIADVFVVNKADRPGADETVRELRQMLNLTTGAAKPAIVRTVAVKGEGISELWDAIAAHRSRQESDGSLAARRRRRITREVSEIALQRQRRRIVEGSSPLLEELTDEVLAGRLDPHRAADRLLDELDRRRSGDEGPEGARR